MCAGVREWMPGFWGQAQVSRLPGKSLTHSGGYYSVTMIKRTSRKGFIWVYASRGRKVPRHYNREVWKQAACMAAGTGKNSNLILCAGSHENKLKMVHVFMLLKHVLSDTHPTKGPHLLCLPKLCMETRLASNSEIYLPLPQAPNAGIKGGATTTWYDNF